jgi:hypothetical protein
MLAIQGIYDGVAIKPMEEIPFNEEYEVVITFLKPQKEKLSEKDNSDITERLAVIDSMIGVLPSTVTNDEIKEERMKRYERSY